MQEKIKEEEPTLFSANFPNIKFGEEGDSSIIEEEKVKGIEQKLLKDDFSIQNLLTFVGFFVSVHLLLRFITDFIDYYWIVDVLLKSCVLVEASLPLAVSFFLNNTKQATRLRVLGIIVLIGYIFTILWS